MTVRKLGLRGLRPRDWRGLFISNRYPEQTRLAISRYNIDTGAIDNTHHVRIEKYDESGIIDIDIDHSEVCYLS